MATSTTELLAATVNIGEESEADHDENNGTLILVGGRDNVKKYHDNRYIENDKLIGDI